MMVEAPERSLQQRMDALEKANEIRYGRARLKRDIKAGRKSVAELLQEPPELIRTMRVWDLLIATPKLGRVKVNRMFTQCRVSQTKTVGGLSDRQRKEMISLLA